jgi:membrane-bound serine protease (ClpP class)
MPSGSFDIFGQLPWWLIIVICTAVVLFVVVAVQKSLQAHRSTPTTGEEGLPGECGVASTDIVPEGKVFVRGEYWDAWSDEQISSGERIVVVSVERMRVKVRKAREGER